MSNEDIVKNIQKGIDVTANQEMLWLNNKGIIYKQIRGFHIFGDNGIADDLAQQGFIGLINAAAKYEPGETHFIAYAIPFVRGAMFQFMAQTYNHFHIPQYMRSKIRKYNSIQKEAKNSGIDFSDSYAAERMEVSIDKIYQIKEIINRITTYSMDETTPYTDNEFMEYIKSDENLENAVISSVYEKELHDTLDKALSVIDAETRQIIKSVFYGGFSKQRMAELCNCSNARICSMIERGFQKILKSEYREVLEQFMWEGFHYRYEKAQNFFEEESTESEPEQVNLFLI